MKESKNSSTKSCNSTAVAEHVFKMGSLMTNNIFFVEDVLYIELLETKQYVTDYTNNVIVHRQVQSSVYLAWNYKTHDKRYVDCNTFRTQLTLFKYFKNNHEGYTDTLMGELLDYDLCNLAIRSEHMF